MMNMETLPADLAVVVGSSTALSLIIKATVLLGIGLASVWLLPAAKASVRHLILTCTFLALLALPLTWTLMPEVLVIVPAEDVMRSEPARSSGAAVAPMAISGPAAQAPANRAVRLSLGESVRLAWALGAAVLLGSLSLGLWRLRQLRRRGLPALHLRPVAEGVARAAGLRRSVQVLMHEQVVAPLTCGVRTATILLPTDAERWTHEEIQRAFVHELEHARRYDWPVQVLARLACALYWFHPLAWIAWRHLRLEAERACDDAVVQRGESTDYAEQLVMLARRMAHRGSSTSLAMASRSDLSARVSALLDGRQRRGRAGMASICAAGVVSVALLMAISPVVAVESTDGAGAGVLLGSTDAAQDRAGLGGASLYNAARRGDLERMTRLIDQGADVNAALDGDGSPLIAAARAGHLQAVALLLNRGADPNMAVPGDGNPLIMAARNGHREVVALLLDRGAHVNQIVPSDENALIQASGNGHATVVKLLLARGADPNIRILANASPDGRGGEWRTALGMARQGRHTAVVELLLAAGARE